MKLLGERPESEPAIRRFAAWWIGEVLDRPPVTLTVRRTRPYRGPESRHATLRERWLDVEFNVSAAIASLECDDFVGDRLPCVWPNIGPELSATLFGCELDFGEHTSWSRPVVHRPEDWDRIAAMRPDFSNVYWRTMEQMTDAAITRCGGRYVVGLTDLHGNYDLLAGLRDPQHLCLDILDCPELVQRAGRQVAAGFVAAFERAYARVAAAGFGSTCWTPAYHRGPAYVPSCDFWCVVSPEVARDMILPDIVAEMRPLERSIFHLDGPQALRHLDLLLALPQLHAVQWVYGAGAGTASRWVDVYRRILAAGKSAQVICQTAAEALSLLETLGPRGVWLDVAEWFNSVPEAEAFLRQVEAMCRARR